MENGRPVFKGACAGRLVTLGDTAAAFRAGLLKGAEIARAFTCRSDKQWVSETADVIADAIKEAAR